MPRPVGTIGETKLKILAIIHHNELQGTLSYGYSIWRLLKKRFYLYMDEGDCATFIDTLKNSQVSA